jgi:hypothetical protein
VRLLAAGRAVIGEDCFKVVKEPLKPLGPFWVSFSVTHRGYTGIKEVA